MGSAVTFSSEILWAEKIVQETVGHPTSIVIIIFIRKLIFNLSIFFLLKYFTTSNTRVAIFDTM